MVLAKWWNVTPNHLILYFSNWVPLAFGSRRNFERVRVVSQVPQKNYNQFERRIAANLAKTADNFNSLLTEGDTILHQQHLIIISNKNCLNLKLLTWEKVFVDLSD